MRTFIINVIAACVMGGAWHVYYKIMSVMAINGQVIVPTWVIGATEVAEYVMTAIVIALPVTLILGLVEVVKSKRVAA